MSNNVVAMTVSLLPVLVVCVLLLLLVFFEDQSVSAWVITNQRQGANAPAFQDSLIIISGRPPITPLVSSRHGRTDVVWKSQGLFSKDNDDDDNAEYETDREEDSSLPPTTIPGRLVTSGAVSHDEVSALVELVASIPIADQLYVRVEEAANDSKIDLPAAQLPPGATGRVAMIELEQDDIAIENLEDRDDIPLVLEAWKAILSQHIDEILYREDDDLRCFQQPILLSVVTNPASNTSATTPTDTYYQEHLLALIQEQLQDYGLADAVEKHHEIIEIPATNPSMVTPRLWYEIDGAMVVDDNNNNNNNNKEDVWDTSSVLVFDHLLGSAVEERNLRERMLDVVLGRDGENSNQHWDDVQDGPDPARWTAGRLTDLPTTDTSENIRNNEITFPESYGLSDEALDEICEEDPPPLAFQEFESILSDLLWDFTVTRLPEAVLGGGVTPLTANAPCFGQTFDYHIDADPYFAPPSPWTDVYGRYANRARGKPRFMSCLIYLNDEWDGTQWGAPTRFLDVATGTEIDITPKPGRVVLMDQDITHTVVAPLEASGKRPRYSLVWKLILHPKRQNQDMRDLAGSHTGWPGPVLVGSAKR